MLRDLWKLLSSLLAGSSAIDERIWLARKLTISKWREKPGFTSREVPADTVTSDARTTDNALSFWNCDPTQAQSLEDAVLAVAVSGDRLDSLGLAWLRLRDLDADGVAVTRTPVATPVHDLQGRHYDAIRLDTIRLARVAARIADSVRRTNQARQFTRLDVKKILQRAIQEGRLRPEELKQDIRNAVG